MSKVEKRELAGSWGNKKSRWRRSQQGGGRTLAEVVTGTRGHGGGGERNLASLVAVCSPQVVCSI